MTFQSRISCEAEALSACRCMRVSLCHRVTESPALEESEFTLYSNLLNPLTTPTYTVLESLLPQWTGCDYSLDFNSSFRIVPSVKNFILADANGSHVIKMYKVAKKEFVIEVCGIEISPIQVLTIAIACIDRKLCTQ